MRNAAAPAEARSAGQRVVAGMALHPVCRSRRLGTHGLWRHDRCRIEGRGSQRCSHRFVDNTLGGFCRGRRRRGRGFRNEPVVQIIQRGGLCRTSTTALHRLRSGFARRRSLRSGRLARSSTRLFACGCSGLAARGSRLIARLHLLFPHTLGFGIRGRGRLGFLARGGAGRTAWHGGDR